LIILRHLERTQNVIIMKSVMRLSLLIFIGELTCLVQSNAQNEYDNKIF
jgi:hypothetical protein